MGMNPPPIASGPVFYEDNSVNLFYLNELYKKVAQDVSRQLKTFFQVDIPMSSGIWGGTYLIADATGKSRRRIWRFYCLVNLPQNSPLDQQKNLEHWVGIYSTAMIRAFAPHGLKLELKMWGGRLPFSNRQRPNMTLHLEDSTGAIRWLRPIVVWNTAPWEESVIYDTIRLIRELKQNLDYDRGPTLREPQEIKYLLQDVIITFLTLKGLHSAEFLQHAEPLIQDLMKRFMAGLHDPEEIREMYARVLHNALIYGYEEGLGKAYGESGLDIQQFENWPADRINWVPEEVKEKLVPPIKELFRTFQANLSANRP